MRRETEKSLLCNGCGRKLIRKNGIYREDFVDLRKKWGYFSRKDTQNHRLILCEDCYDRLTGLSVLPPQIEEETELLSIG